MFDHDPRTTNDERDRDDDVRDREHVDPRDAFVNQLDLLRIPAIVIAQSGHRDRRFWAS
jgi:hypothetical protein